MSENTTTMTVPYVQAVDDAVAAIAAGGFAVVIDDADRENEGDLIGAAGLMDSEQLAFMVRHTTGIICAPMTADRAAALDLPQMVEHNTDSHSTAFTVTVDHRDVSTGVSAVDRTLTLRALADPSTRRADLRRPGHVFPLRAREGGVLTRAGHTEAAVDLVRKGEAHRFRRPRPDGRVLRIADLMRYRGTSESVVQRVAEASMPTEFGHFDAVVYRSGVDGIEHLALVLGDVAAAGRGRDGALVRVHSECLTGDIIGSLRCDCGYQLEQALRAVADEGCGVVVYLRGHEGRGIGLAHKIRAYALQEDGLDTVDANTALGQPVDSRSYGVGAAILADLGVRRLRLITNNPAKFGGLDGYELDIVGRVGLPSKVTPYNVRYLRTKRDRMGHLLADDPEISPACEG